MRIRLDLAYDGAGFAGWARQPGLRTVQGELEDALAQVLRAESRGVATPRLTVAGRTDAGVHARGQVAHVDVDGQGWAALPGRSGREPGAALVRRLTGVVGRDVVVRRATVAPEGFDARFSALERRYEYRIADDGVVRDPLHRGHVVWWGRPLDVEAMAEAAEPLRGRHDFAAFCRQRAGATTIRTLEEFTWRRQAPGPHAGGEAGLVSAVVRADAFCHSMVRALVGACLAVGEGTRPVTWPGELLAGGERHPSSRVAPAHGLTLEEVTYPPAPQLAARAEQTRARRAALPEG